MAKNLGAITADRDWRAEQDMRALVEAEAIRNDPKRLKAAQKAAKAKLEEMEAAFPDAEGKDEDD